MVETASHLWTAVALLWKQGGMVMPWLVTSTIVLWYAVGVRSWLLRRGDRRPLSAVVEEHLAGRGVARGVIGSAVAAAVAAGPDSKGKVREAVAPWYDDVERYGVLIRTLAATAPLVGLLGTVSGMIETFDSLATMSLYRGSGGIAGGISEALVSTQMGLSVAIPGLLAARMLDRRQALLEAELDGLPEVLLQRTRRASR